MGRLYAFCKRSREWGEKNERSATPTPTPTPKHTEAGLGRRPRPEDGSWLQPGATLHTSEAWAFTMLSACPCWTAVVLEEESSWAIPAPRPRPLPGGKPRSEPGTCSTGHGPELGARNGPRRTLGARPGETGRGLRRCGSGLRPRAARMLSPRHGGGFSPPLPGGREVILTRHGFEPRRRASRAPAERSSCESSPPPPLPPAADSSPAPTCVSPSASAPSADWASARNVTRADPRDWPRPAAPRLLPKRFLFGAARGRARRAERVPLSWPFGSRRRPVCKPASPSASLPTGNCVGELHPPRSFSHLLYLQPFHRP